MVAVFRTPRATTCRDATRSRAPQNALPIRPHAAMLKETITNMLRE